MLSDRFAFCYYQFQQQFISPSLILNIRYSHRHILKWNKEVYCNHPGSSIGWDGACREDKTVEDDLLFLKSGGHAVLKPPALQIFAWGLLYVQSFWVEWRARRAHSSTKCLLQNLGKYQHIPAQLTQTIWILTTEAEIEWMAVILLPGFH